MVRGLLISINSKLSESSAVEIDNIYLQLSQPGRNWNQAELAALKRRQAKLYRREIRETHRNHLKRNTQRFTEVSSFGGMSHTLLLIFISKIKDPTVKCLMEMMIYSFTTILMIQIRRVFKLMLHRSRPYSNIIFAILF